jgi:hypothetical protein
MARKSDTNFSGGIDSSNNGVEPSRCCVALRCCRTMVATKSLSVMLGTRVPEMVFCLETVLGTRQQQAIGVNPRRVDDSLSYIA